MNENYDFFRNPELVKMEKEYEKLNKMFIKTEKEYEDVLDGVNPNASYELEKELELKLDKIRSRMSYLSGEMENLNESKKTKKRIIVTESQMNIIRESLINNSTDNIIYRK